MPLGQPMVGKRKILMRVHSAHTEYAQSQGTFAQLARLHARDSLKVFSRSTSRRWTKQLPVHRLPGKRGGAASKAEEARPLAAPRRALERTARQAYARQEAPPSRYAMTA